MKPIPTKETRAQWRKEADDTMLHSAIWEYCPKEFVELLDAVETLEAEVNRLQKLLSGQFPPITHLRKIVV